jgi:hypothetical protein
MHRRVEGSCDRRGAAELIAFILLQSVRDGMSRVVIGVNLSDNEPYMKYCRRDSAGQFECWDMVPPPAHMFPFLLQYVLSVTELEPSMPIRGQAAARRDGRDITLQVAITPPSEFTISWDREAGGL